MNSLAWTSGPAGCDAAAACAPMDSRLNRGLAVLIGALLGFTALDTGDGAMTGRLLSVDLICAVLLGVLFVRHRMRRIPDAALVFAASMGLSLIPAFMISQGTPDRIGLGFLSALIALGFYVAGLNLGGAPGLLRSLVVGMSAGVFGSALVVGLNEHGLATFDLDPGSLAACAFCAAGFLATFGRGRLPMMAAFAAGAAAFIAAGSAGTAALVVWVGLIGVTAWRSADRRSYHAFIIGVAAFLILSAAFWPQISASAVGRPFAALIERSGAGILRHFEEAFRGAGRWLPFGLGVGLETGVSNGVARVAAEFGLLGLAGFAGMIAFPLIRLHQRGRSSERGTALLFSFLTAAAVFMIGSPLHRDRTFLLFLGVATAAALGPRRPAVPAVDDTPVFAAVPLLQLFPPRLEIPSGNRESV